MQATAGEPLDYVQGKHVVQFYEGDAFLVDAITRFLRRAFRRGERGLVIASEPHRRDLRRVLGGGADAKCLMVDAAETLTEFMVEGWPDEARFRETMARLLDEAAGRHGANACVFGEMVAILWAQGNAPAALRLETFWNDIGRRVPFSLLCAYPVAIFAGREQPPSFADVCSAHSEVMPTEAYAALGTPRERLRTIALLQHRAAALPRETEERKRAELSLHEKEQEIAEAGRLKDEFLAMLGHELRNPLSAIRSAVASADLDSASRTRALDIAKRQVEQLARLIDDLLDVARITYGRIALRKERVDLADIVERAAEGLRRVTDERDQALLVDVPSGELFIEADPIRLEQVIANLLTNAAKFTSAGARIEIFGKRDDGHAVFSVRDDGVGIAPELLPQVFDLFRQGDRALDRSQGGLGIGLTIVRRLIELHGGRIEARSEGVGKGAEFVVRLPLSAPSSKHVSPAADHPLERRDEPRANVLVVEDNRDAAESLKMFLDILGHDVRVLHDGAGALEEARRRRPDAMIVDIGLPGMDGYQIARSVRADRGVSDLVLVALTGYGREEDKQRALAAGFDYYLMKPVDPDALERLVAEIGRQGSERTPGSQGFDLGVGEELHSSASRLALPTSS